MNDQLDGVNFDGMLPSEAWDACEAYECHAYDAAESFSDDDWDNVVAIVCANYDRYYAKYEG